MEHQHKLDKIKLPLTVFQIAIMVFLLTGSIVFADPPAETNTSPNYIVLLVHGINTTHRVFMGHGENRSDVSRIPDDEKYPYGDLKGYLENTLGLKGYVYAYTFSERDGRISLAAEELGDPNHDNKAATISSPTTPAAWSPLSISWRGQEDRA